MIISKAQMGIIEFFDLAYIRHKRYWSHRNMNSTEPSQFPPAWSELLKILSKREPGRALDIGAGEGSDAIRLARMGYEVDAVEGSAVGAEKIGAFSKEAGVRINVIHADAHHFVPTQQYDLVICNGLLHYIDDINKTVILDRIQRATRVGGYNMVFLFSDHDPIPECHKVIDLYCDAEDGIVRSSYRNWQHRLFLEHNKADTAHSDFPLHRHSFIKIVAQKPLS